MNRFLGLILLLASSCAHDKAEELYDNKLYKESLKAYQKILKDDPDDVDAHIGVKKSKSGFDLRDGYRSKITKTSGK